MIDNPFALLTLFVFIVTSILFLYRWKRAQKLFKYLPVPLWCYFIPTALSTVGWIPSESPTYAQMSRSLLPPCLILILLGTNLPALFKLRREALLAMFAGTLGIFMGGLATFLLLSNLRLIQTSIARQEQFHELWKGWGCLSASWTGGSANMIAVKEILNAPESLFSNLIIVDTLVAYSWMALLVYISQYQKPINIKLKAQEIETIIPSSLYREENARLKVNLATKAIQKSFLLIFAFAMGRLCWSFSSFFPTVGSYLNRTTWTIVWATVIPLLLSMTSAKKMEDWGAGATGTFLLYLLLTSIGARANLYALVSAPLLIAAGILWVFIHGTVLILFGKAFKIPISLLATASQANVGGPVSAPLVASIYDKNLTAVGIVLAVLGNIYGTAFGLLFSEVCRRI